jgi:methionine-rich copper-binding protein CopC
VFTKAHRAVLATVFAVILLSAAPVQAHTYVTAVDPADGSTLSTGPATVAVTFSEPPQAEFAALSVIGPDDTQWADGTPRVDGTTLTVAVRELGPAGTYTIAYRVAAQDGHPITGSSTFQLLTPGGGAPGQTAETDSEARSIPVAAGAGVAALAVLALVVVAMRRSRGRGPDEA